MPGGFDRSRPVFGYLGGDMVRLWAKSEFTALLRDRSMISTTFTLFHPLLYPVLQLGGLSLRHTAHMHAHYRLFQAVLSGDRVGLIGPVV